MSGKAEDRPLLASATMEKRVPMPHIQGFRFIAMFWIITYHYLKSDYDSPLGKLVQDRPLDLFTVMSGFVTHLSYRKKQDLGSCWDFWMRRSSRIFFMYYGTLLLVLFFKMCHIGYTGGSMHDIAELYFWFVPSLFFLNVWWSWLPIFFPDTETAPWWANDARWHIWPVNGVLWYIQALVFVWATYPLFRDWMNGLKRTAIIHWVVGLWSLSVLPAVVVLIRFQGDAPFLRVAEPPELRPYWTFVKVFPPFMLAQFYLGSMICCLFFDEMSASQGSDTIEPESGKASDSNSQDWHSYATVIGEGLFVLFLVLIFALALLPGHVAGFLRMHIFCIVFGFVLFCFAVANALEQRTGQKGYGLGLKYVLDSDFMREVGDASLVAYTIQQPVNTLYYIVLHYNSQELGNVEAKNWMNGFVFVAYMILLYGISVPISRYIDIPISASIQKMFGRGSSLQRQQPRSQ